MGKIALVTGAARGIGRACAERLAADGMTVVSLDRDPIEDAPGPAIAYDLERVDGLEELVTGVRADVGPIDVLVNNAAMFWPTPLDQLSLSDLQRILTVNLVAPAMLAVTVGRTMKERRTGRIIFISSVKDTFGERGALPYDIAKGGISQATRSLAVELGPHGVLVNAVAPGFVRTELSVVDGVNELDTPEFHQHYIDSGRIPMRRPSKPPEIAGCVAWLAGDECSYVNGEILRADGGLSVAL